MYFSFGVKALAQKPTVIWFVSMKSKATCTDALPLHTSKSCRIFDVKVIEYQQHHTSG